MLQMMQRKVEQEGKTEQDLFEKFMCYCKNGASSLETSVKDGEQKVTLLESSIEEADALKKQLDGDIAKAKADQAEVKDTLGKAKALRQKEHSSFVKVSGEARKNIAAMESAMSSISKGMGASFLQS